jgi:hypothetical protein
MDGELRCPVKLHGLITEDGLLEVKCNSSRCGHGSGVVVLHYFDPHTGQLKETKTFREPASLFSTKE